MKMSFSEQDVVFCIPEKFWEVKEPIKCIVEKYKEADFGNIIESSTDSIYVYSEERGKNVYINRKYLFFSEEKCIEAIELYSKLYSLYFKDESDYLEERLGPSWDYEYYT